MSNTAQCNVSNRTIFCHDNLEILQGINTECIDLIYLDPPFNKKKVFTAPIGSSAEGAGFKDIFYQEDIKNEWLITIKEDHFALHEILNSVKNIEGRTSYNFCYLAYMAIRLIELHRILKDTGNIFLHCDSTMGHYLKILMDCIFGERNFRNDIIWKRKSEKHNLAVKQMPKSWDCILWYGKTHQSLYHVVFIEHNPQYIDKTYTGTDDPRGRYATFPCTNEKGGNKVYEFRGISRAWRFSKEHMEELYNDNMLTQATPTSPFRYKKFLHTTEGVKQDDLWVDIKPVRGTLSTDYPTQKPLALLERIIKASSNPGDMVLDPFCGCATTCVAAEKLDRQWIGIDISHKAYELVKERIVKEAIRPDILFEADTAIQYTTTPPERTDGGTPTQPTKSVYVISHPRYTGEYKVGIANNVKSRLNSYQTADPDRAYKLEFSMATPYFRETEAFIHTKYDNKHEWVHGNLHDIIKDIENYKIENDGVL